MSDTDQTSSITIRRAEPTDYEAIQRIFASPIATAGTLQDPFPSLETWRKRLSATPEGTYLLVACAEDQVVGQLGLDTFPHKPRRRHAGQIGIIVRDDWQGKGVGTALLRAAVDLADRWLNLTRLELEVFIDNEPAVRLYKRFGFVIEGTLARYAFRDGEFVDAYTMARLREA